MVGTSVGMLKGGGGRCGGLQNTGKRAGSVARTAGASLAAPGRLEAAALPLVHAQAALVVHGAAAWTQADGEAKRLGQGAGQQARTDIVPVGCQLSSAGWPGLCMLSVGSAVARCALHAGGDGEEHGMLQCRGAAAAGADGRGLWHGPLSICGPRCGMRGCAETQVGADGVGVVDAG